MANEPKSKVASRIAPPVYDAAQLSRLRKTTTKKSDGRANNGRPVGSTNKLLLPKSEVLGEGLVKVFGHLTENEIQQILPIDVFRLVTIAAVRAEDYTLAMAAAERWAPYVHAKLAPKVIEADAPVINVKGGLPDRHRQLN